MLALKKLHIICTSCPRESREWESFAIYCSIMRECFLHLLPIMYLVHISKVTVCSLETLYPLKFWCVSLVKTVLSIFWCFPDTFCGLHPSGSDAANRDASQSEKFMTSWWEVKQRLLQQRKTNATFGRTKGGQLAYLNRFSFDEEETKNYFYWCVSVANSVC